ncbi:TPA: DEAD/DEAH box helicase family protein [Candidatus Woesearchaeota archaeon]|nr:DEAD/DEAH box helicase family protein [Candidatus Woesearchaeota archaeon]
MVSLNIKKIPFLEHALKEKDYASPTVFKLAVLAKQIASVETVNELIARSTYADKIEIMEHQTRTALHVLNNFSHRALLADEVGLGKTIEAGIIIKEYIARKLADKILILTPATLKFQWQEELRSKFNEHFVIADDPSTYKETNRIIASIDTAKTERHKKVLTSIKWDLIVVDEAHKLKNSTTLNYKLVKDIEKERCLMLTATPLQNNIFELWALLDLLHPGFLETKAKFTSQYVQDKDGLKVKNSIELQEKLSKIMIRNLRRDTGIKFAERHVKTHLLDYSKEEMDFYTEAIAFVRKQYEEIKKIEKDISTEETEELESLSEEELHVMASRYRQKGLLTFALIMLTRQITSSLQAGIHALQRYKETLDDPKKVTSLEALLLRAQRISRDRKLDYLTKLLKNEKEKVIIFTTFIQSQKIIDLELKMNGFKTVIFNGVMTPEEKEAAIQQFKSDAQVLICTDAGSEGRNLQFAHILINFDLPWNPMRLEQRIGRVHRIGQKQDVEIHNIAIKDTIEAYILNRLYEKINLFTVSIGEMDMILSELTTKGSIEKSIFESYLKNDDIIAQDLSQAKEKVEEIKKFDETIFSGMIHEPRT